MAALSSKLVGPAGLPTVGLLANKGRILAVGAVNLQVPKANIYSKTSGMLEPRLKPWPYETLGFGYLYHLIDGTTKRFNANTKMVVVDGPPALEKSKFARELADELDMLYIPPVSMEDFYINPDGYDLRELDHKFHYPRNVSFDEKKFAQNPTGQDGGLDRMLDIMQQMRYASYLDALAHLFNTGRGIVMEKSPYSEHVYVEAAYQQGWIDKTSRALFYRKRENTLQYLLRPNLIVYLDAPLDVVQAKIRARAQTTHPWEKNSPVYENRDYMQHCYWDLLKKQYITKEAAISSQVLVYDWSDGGDTEVVVEDIERLNMDYFDKYDKQQKDWRMHNEENYAKKRLELTRRDMFLSYFNVDYWHADKVNRSQTERADFLKYSHRVPGSRYIQGFNEELGNPSALLRPSFMSNWRRAPAAKYSVDASFEMGSSDYEEYMRKRQEKKEKGEERWWQF